MPSRRRSPRRLHLRARGRQPAAARHDQQGRQRRGDRPLRPAGLRSRLELGQALLHDRAAGRDDGRRPRHRRHLAARAGDGPAPPRRPSPGQGQHLDLRPQGDDAVPVGRPGHDRRDRGQGRGAAQGDARQGPDMSWHDPNSSILEAALGRGDRRLGAVIRRAWQKGARFDAWDEHFDFEIWLEAFAEEGLDPAWYAQRDIPTDEPLPWAHMGAGVSTGIPAARPKARAGRADHGRLPLGTVLQLRRARGDRVRLRHGRGGAAAGCWSRGRRRRWRFAGGTRAALGDPANARRRGATRAWSEAACGDNVEAGRGERRGWPYDLLGERDAVEGCGAEGSCVAGGGGRRRVHGLNSGETTLELIRLFVLLVGAAALVTLLARRINLPYTVALVGFGIAAGAFAQPLGSRSRRSSCWSCCCRRSSSRPRTRPTSPSSGRRWGEWRCSPARASSSAPLSSPRPSTSARGWRGGGIRGGGDALGHGSGGGHRHVQAAGNAAPPGHARRGGERLQRRHGHRRLRHRRRLSSRGRSAGEVGARVRFGRGRLGGAWRGRRLCGVAHPAQRRRPPDRDQPVGGAGLRHVPGGRRAPPVRGHRHGRRRHRARQLRPAPGPVAQGPRRRSTRSGSSWPSWPRPSSSWSSASPSPSTRWLDVAVPIAWAIAATLAAGRSSSTGCWAAGVSLSERRRVGTGRATGPARVGKRRKPPDRDEGAFLFDWLHVVFWSGLRGAVSTALALSLPVDFPDPPQLQGITFGVVLFTLLVQATTAELVVARWGRKARDIEARKQRSGRIPSGPNGCRLSMESRGSPEADRSGRERGPAALAARLRPRRGGPIPLAPRRGQAVGASVPPRRHPRGHERGLQPRPKLIFAAPLQLGMLAEHELADLFLAERLTAPGSARPAGGGDAARLRVVDLHDVWIGAPALAPQLAAADYRLTLLNVEPRPAGERGRAAAGRGTAAPRASQGGADDPVRPAAAPARSAGRPCGSRRAAARRRRAAQAAGCGCGCATRRTAAAGAPTRSWPRSPGELGLSAEVGRRREEAGRRRRARAGRRPVALEPGPKAPAALEVVRPVRERLWLADELDPAGSESAARADVSAPRQVAV
jgi:hypothetical protein